MMKDLTERDLDEYFELLNKEKLTKKEVKRKEDILLTGMLVRALGGHMPTKRAEKKLIKMILKD